MTIDDDDDFVVPSGSRRSSYVPPSEESDFVPSMPAVSEPEAPTSSTGPVPSIGSASDEHVAQSPVWADSVEIPVEPAPVQPSIVIELPSTDVPAESGTDQFGLPILDAEPIDIPQVVVSDPLPEALPGTGSVFDDNRMFPPIVTTEQVGEVVEDPIIEEFGSSTPTESIVLDASPSDEGTESSNLPGAPGEPGPTLVVPVRQSLTPSALAEVLGANGGMSSNDQMALLDSQIPLREADAAAVDAFIAQANAIGTPEAIALIGELAPEFADLVPELLSYRSTHETVDSEFSDDSTPVTGVPVVEHVGVIEVIENESGEVVEIDVVELEVSEQAPAFADTASPTPPVVAGDEQSWSLPVPAELISDEEPNVPRRHWWTLAGYGAIVSALIVAGFAQVVSFSDSQPMVWLVVAGVAAAIPFLEPARHFHTRTGATWRMGLEEVFGRIPGRSAAAGFAAIVALALIAVTSELTQGLGRQLEASSVLGSFITGILPNGGLGDMLAALALLGGSLMAALPHHWYRAKALVLIGWTLSGTGAIAAMGAFLLLSTPASDLPLLGGALAQFGIVAASALVLVPSSIDGIQSITRIRDGKSGSVWLYIGLTIGLLSTAAVVTAALLNQGGSHWFFGENPVLHIIAPSALLNDVLGALAFVPAILLITTLGFRAMSSATTRDDRENPHVATSWLLLLIPAALGFVAYLGFAPIILEYLPSVTVLAVPVAATLGVLAARGSLGRHISGRGTRRGLLAVALVSTALGWGFASSDGSVYAWVGYLNQMLLPYGYGLLYMDTLAPVAVAIVSFTISLIVVGVSTRRRGATS